MVLVAVDDSSLKTGTNRACQLARTEGR